MADREVPEPASLWRSPRRRSPSRRRSGSPRRRSASPPRRSRDRQSPDTSTRREDRPRQLKTGGFKWKQKPSASDDRDSYNRDRDGRRGRDRGDRRNRSRSRDRGRDDRDWRGRRAPPSEEASRRVRSDNATDAKASSSSSYSKPKGPKKDKKDDGDTGAPAPVAADGEEMIVVHVNDRLGTKAAIPCFASDNIGVFKVMVASRIGREPHEILLKRQGERPFKDHISLGDYGISNGVQLDLEVDTGD